MVRKFVEVIRKFVEIVMGRTELAGRGLRVFVGCDERMGRTLGNSVGVAIS